MAVAAAIADLALAPATFLLLVQTSMSLAQALPPLPTLEQGPDALFSAGKVVGELTVLSLEKIDLREKLLDLGIVRLLSCAICRRKQPVSAWMRSTCLLNPGGGTVGVLGAGAVAMVDAGGLEAGCY